MGDHISIGQALIITGFSMVVVFIGLIIISILISALKIINKDEKTEIKKEVIKEAVVPNKASSLSPEMEIENDEELVAVISAAIAASMGISIPELNIKSIRRMPQTTPAWAVASRQEQISNKL